MRGSRKLISGEVNFEEMPFGRKNTGVLRSGSSEEMTGVSKRRKRRSLGKCIVNNRGGNIVIIGERFRRTRLSVVSY